MVVVVEASVEVVIPERLESEVEEREREGSACEYDVRADERRERGSVGGRA